jgi:hypothetical protein
MSLDNSQLNNYDFLKYAESYYIKTYELSEDEKNKLIKF